MLLVSLRLSQWENDVSQELCNFTYDCPNIMTFVKNTVALWLSGGVSESKQYLACFDE